MKMKLDKIDLSRHAEWMRKSYDEKFDRIIDSFERMVFELKELRARKPEYGNDNYNFNASYRASEVQSLVTQSIASAQIYQMINAASSLDTVEEALVGIEDLRKELPPEIVTAWEKIEIDREAKRAADLAADEAKRIAETLNQCHFKRFGSRCGRNGKVEVKGKLYCAQHSKHPDCGQKHCTV